MFSLPYSYRPNHDKCLFSGFMEDNTMLRNVRVTTMAQKRLTKTPSARVMAKPFTIVAPNEDPKMKRIKQVIRVAMLESRMDGQARFQARSTACKKVRPLRSSSFKR